MSEKRAEIEQLRSRLSIGLDKLLSTAAQVEVMQKELTELQPVLVVTAKEVEDMMVTITADKASADQTKQQVAVQEAEATAQVRTPLSCRRFPSFRSRRRKAVMSKKDQHVPMLSCFGNPRLAPCCAATYSSVLWCLRSSYTPAASLLYK